MADSAPVMIWLADPDGSRTYFNRSWLEFTGRPLGDEIRDAGPDDVVIVLSHRSYSRDAVNIARYAKGAGSQIISIVDSSLAPTVAISDVKLVLSASN